MKEYKLLIVLFSICWALALVSLNSSIPDRNDDPCVSSKMSGSLSSPVRFSCHNYPGGLFKVGNILEWVAAGFFILPLGVFAMLKWKHEFATEYEIESLKLAGRLGDNS